jgi:hypothetical protein
MIFPEKILICPEKFFSFSGKNYISGKFFGMSGKFFEMTSPASPTFPEKFFRCPFSFEK